MFVCRDKKVEHIASKKKSMTQDDTEHAHMVEQRSRHHGTKQREGMDIPAMSRDEYAACMMI